MKALPNHIVFVHLTNDFSGSPLILAQVINSVPMGTRKTLYVSSQSATGFLTGLPNVTSHTYWYRWQAQPLLRLVTFVVSQLILFCKLLRWWRQPVVFYCNTILPFGAALAACVMRKNIVYHLHETSMRPKLLKWFLRTVANNTAHTAIHVSHYLKKQELLPRAVNYVLPNAAPWGFEKEARLARHVNKRPVQPFTVLMACSLKPYKGIAEFVALAAALPQLRFWLLLNATKGQADTFFQKQLLPPNLTLYTGEHNLHPFYQQCALVVNLSHTDVWIETFGMTVLEAMHYGRPVIVPPVGGPAELVSNGVNGFCIESKQHALLKKTVLQLATDVLLYHRMASAAHATARQYSSQLFTRRLQAILAQLFQKPMPGKASYAYTPSLPKNHKSFT